MKLSFATFHFIYPSIWIFFCLFVCSSFPLPPPPRLRTFVTVQIIRSVSACYWFHFWNINLIVSRSLHCWVRLLSYGVEICQIQLAVHSKRSTRKLFRTKSMWKIWKSLFFFLAVDLIPTGSWNYFQHKEELCWQKSKLFTRLLFEFLGIFFFQLSLSLSKIISFESDWHSFTLWYGMSLI